jgi:hypothetical protein
MRAPPRAVSFAVSIAQCGIISKFDIVSSNIEEVLNMAEVEPKAIDGEPTPEPPLNASDVARKIKDDPKELYREVSGAYEAKQEREAGRKKQEKEGPA